MKKIVFLAFLAIVAFQLEGQASKVDKLQALEQNKPDNQYITTTATLKAASRLFATKDDLTSVILIIPADSVVAVLDSDSTYLHVVFEENEGYIFRRQAILEKVPVNAQPIIQSQPAAQQTDPVQEQQQNRISYLENKYGSNVANRIFSGKIWKGMNSEMVKDSWGTADKINRIISGNITKEEWIFRSTWLYFENNTLLEWGPVKK
jgi:hypothetical protein